jgi:citrate lyase subunit beta/citryl-CoA lyase
VGLPADSFVFDLEDGVAAAEKPTARRCVAEALKTLDFGSRERVVRINAISSGHLTEDLQALPTTRLDTILVPKVEAADEVKLLADQLSALERTANREKPIRIIASIETPRGLLAALPIAEASPRLAGLFLGSGDYAAATGGVVGERMLAVPRSLVVAAASAAGIQAIDAAYFLDMKNVEATRADALIAREIGFSGKLVFHPSQIAVCNEVFSPSPAEVEKARRIVEAWRAAQAASRGTALVDGSFIAIDVALMAERVLARAARIAELAS